MCSNSHWVLFVIVFSLYFCILNGLLLFLKCLISESACSCVCQIYVNTCWLTERFLETIAKLRAETTVLSKWMQVKKWKVFKNTVAKTNTDPSYTSLFALLSFDYWARRPQSRMYIYAWLFQDLEPWKSILFIMKYLVSCILLQLWKSKTFLFNPYAFTRFLFLVLGIWYLNSSPMSLMYVTNYWNWMVLNQS